MDSEVIRREHALERYRAATPGSKRLAARARACFPDGVGRAGMPCFDYPDFIARAAGQYLFDVDGRRILDMSNGHSALPLGHAHPHVMAAVERQLRNGLGFGLMTEAEVELGEILCARVKLLERLRFTASGTEATMFAIRLARAFTGRQRFARIEGSYHGTTDMFMSGMGLKVGQGWRGTGADPVSNGVALSVRDDVLFLPFNDLDRSAALLAQAGPDLAAVIVEPILGGGGGIPADPAFLAMLREACDRDGIVLIFDEMISIGLAPGGATEYFGTAPDLIATGKLVGGGMPMGVFGGRADLMAMLESRNGATPALLHTGTWNGHPLSAAAAVATLEAMTPKSYAYLGVIGDHLREGVQRIADESSVTATVTGAQHFSAIHYCDGPVRDHRDALRSDFTFARAVAFSLLSQGYYMLGGNSNLSTAINVADLDGFFVALRIAFEEARDEDIG